MTPDDVSPRATTARGIRRRPSQALVAKVPEVTALFWIAKLATTAMGETTSDFLNERLGPVIAVPIMLAGLVFALRRQLRRTDYDAWTYWLVVTMVAVFGTTAADALHVVLGIPYIYSTSFYVLVLATVLILWRRSEQTLSIHSIVTRHRERYYWATVLATFALGTAAGDMTATTLHLGYLTSAIVFAGVFTVPAIGYRLGLDPVLAFWFAYIVTRPLGASLSDWGAVTRNRGGLGFGPGWVSLVLTAVILGLIALIARRRRTADVHAPATAQAARRPDTPPALEPGFALE